LLIEHKNMIILHLNASKLSKT